MGNLIPATNAITEKKGQFTQNKTSDIMYTQNVMLGRKLEADHIIHFHVICFHTIKMKKAVVLHNNSFCVPQKKISRMGLKQHEGE